MIYILSPYNIDINTTARNRILSFYSALSKHGLAVKILNPPLLARDTEAKSKGILKYEGDGDDILSFELRENKIEQLIAKLIGNGNNRKATTLLGFLSLLIKGCDFYYPANSLKEYFKSYPLQAQDVLIASGFPYSLFKVAAELAREKNCKVILDYRDPWTYTYIPLDSNALIGRIKNKLQRKTEELCLATAEKAFCDSEPVKKLFPPKYQDKIGVLLNGANLQVIKTERIIAHYPVFRIVYLGTLYNDQLTDLSFFRALSHLIASKQIAQGQLEVLFVGSLSNALLPETIINFGLTEFIKITRRLSLLEAIEIAYTAAAFLHLKYGDRTEIDSSKHLDYLALQKPILLPSSDQGNVEKSIKEQHAGYVCYSENECYGAMQELWEKHQKGESFIIPRSERFLYGISREAEAEKLVKVVKRLV
ncbi:hypothetical protein [Desertivirga arenae]|uniref:hypothetical protein n=1 Tax=Desertivirga arenae TaxID=2810309 RepID=UPI001A960123|nr:hypothetical protein [Pedobacter sp. SYSU D00823]